MEVLDILCLWTGRLVWGLVVLAMPLGASWIAYKLSSTYRQALKMVFNFRYSEAGKRYRRAVMSQTQKVDKGGE